MSGHGGGIPRLQELSYLEVAALAVAEEATFEQIRRRLVDHMIALRENTPSTGNVATFRLALEEPTRYARNASESLKELMKLGLVLKATLPSSASAARMYRNTTFALSTNGNAWTEQLRADKRAAYDGLLSMLWRAHAQFAGYLTTLGVDGITVPLAQWGELDEPRSHERYLDLLADRVDAASQAGRIGWTTSRDDVRTALEAYVTSVRAAAEARGRPDPFKRNQDFVNTCEEALVKFAFQRAGLALDFISQEILRRWTKVLGVANFSYHVPGPTALRAWPTATLDVTPDGVKAHRNGGPDIREAVVRMLAEAYERARRDDPSHSLFVPIYRVRADVCWRLKLPDAQFDRAIKDFLAGLIGADLPFRPNLDPAQYGSVPPTELPLTIEINQRQQTYYSMSLVPRRDRAGSPR